MVGVAVGGAAVAGIAGGTSVGGTSVSATVGASVGDRAVATDPCVGLDATWLGCWGGAGIKVADGMGVRPPAETVVGTVVGWLAARMNSKLAIPA